MKHFFLKGSLILGIVFFLDILVGYLSKKQFTNIPQIDTEVSLMYSSLFSNNTDVLILGASSARHHYNPDALSSRLNLDVYNAGLDGRDIVYSDIILQSYINRGNLRKVVLDIGPTQLDGSWKSRIDILKIFYRESKEVANYYDEETDWQTRLKLFSSLYRYNSTLTDIVKLKLKSVNNTGFSPLYGELEVWNPVISEAFDVDSIELEHLDNIVSVCKANNIQLLIVTSPKAEFNISFDEWLCNYATDKEVTLFNEGRDNYWAEHWTLFKDGNHLNKNGSDIFSEKIATRITDI